MFLLCPEGVYILFKGHNIGLIEHKLILDVRDIKNEALSKQKDISMLLKGY